MPVSHLSLTVSHLPSSCSFYLAALQPLGYRYIGQHNNHVGFGVREADFFICQESPGVKPTAAHVAFDAPSRKAVDTFFSAALKAGGNIHDGPAVRDRATGYYSAAVIDFDGNSIEVVHRDSVDQMVLAPGDAGAEAEGAPEPVENTSRAVDGESPLKSLMNSIVSTTNNTIDTAKDTVTSSDNSKALVGTLLGAAAGAAIAYAMTKSEKPDHLRHPEQTRYHTTYQTVEAPPTPRSAVSVSSHRSRRHSASYSDASGHSSRRPHIRMIEAPPSPPSEVSSRSTIRPKSTRAIEAPPSPPLSAHRKSHIETEVFARTMPPPTSVETYYTVEVEPARSVVSHSSRKTERSHRSRRHSLSSSHRPDLPVATPALPDSPALHKTPADFPLPPSAFSTPFSNSRKSRSSRTSRTEPAEPVLPSSSKASHTSRARSSRAPEAYPLPPSAKTSYVSTRSHHRPDRDDAHPHDRNRGRERGPESYPLPPSAKTSFVSHLPPRRARSVASHSSQSTVKPLTKANLSHQARSLVGGKAATDIDDVETLAPDDSISQVSGKERRRVRRRRGEDRGLDGERVAGSERRSDYRSRR